MTARAQTHSNNYPSGLSQNQTTSQPQSNQNIQPDLDSKAYHATNGAAQQDPQDPFGSHQTNDAANGLFMLAQSGQRGAQQAYSMQQQQQAVAPAQGFDKHANKNSVGSIMSGSTDGGEQYTDNEDAKPNVRGGRGKKATTGKTPQNGKRKPEVNVGKGQANKKQRGSNGNAVSPEMPDDDDDDMMDDHDDPMSDKKMTDEEKRKNFLERNRVAALKCRQRKKQWLANLQQKVEIFSTENDALAATVTQLREEIVGLKTLLLAHKDCPVSQAQGISGMAMHQITGDANSYNNPYNMAMSHGGPGMGQQAQMAQGSMGRS